MQPFSCNLKQESLNKIKYTRNYEQQVFCGRMNSRVVNQDQLCKKRINSILIKVQNDFTTNNRSNKLKRICPLLGYVQN